MNEDDDEDDDDKEEDTDKEDQELFYIFDCVGCKNIFREKADLYKQIENCQDMQIAYDFLYCISPMIAYDRNKI